MLFVLSGFKVKIAAIRISCSLRLLKNEINFSSCRAGPIFTIPGKITQEQIDGKWYFFNAEGVMQKWWVKDGNTWYYLNGSGAMETGWLQDGGKWYFLEASGAMKASQWFEVAGKWYYVDGSGALAVNTTVGGYTVNGNGEWV